MALVLLTHVQIRAFRLHLGNGQGQELGDHCPGVALCPGVTRTGPTVSWGWGCFLSSGPVSLERYWALTFAFWRHLALQLMEIGRAEDFTGTVSSGVALCLQATPDPLTMEG